MCVRNLTPELSRATARPQTRTNIPKKFAAVKWHRLERIVRQQAVLLANTYTQLPRLVKMPTASSAQTSRNATKQMMAATAQCLRGNSLALIINAQHMPKTSRPITAKSVMLQRTSWVNCIAIRGMSRSEQAASAAQPNATPRKSIGLFCVITMIPIVVV